MTRLMSSAARSPTRPSSATSMSSTPKAGTWKALTTVLPHPRHGLGAVYGTTAFTRLTAGADPAGPSPLE